MPEEPKDEGKPVASAPKKKRQRKRELSLKQQRMVKALPKAASIAQAGRSAGYGTKQAALRAYDGIKERAPEILERIGYGEEVVLGNLGKLTGAMETKFFSEKGVVMETREVEANDIRLRANVELAKMHGSYGANKHDGDTGNQPAGITIRLELSSSDEQAQVAAIIAARRVGSGRPAVDAEAHPDAGRQGST